MSWTEVRAIFDEPPADWSPCIEVFREHGVENTVEEENPPSLVGCLVDFSDVQATLDRLSANLTALGASKVCARPYEEEDWEQTWKCFFKLRRVGKRFVIRPTWEEIAPSDEDLVITLDPGLAFGTGDHPTTRMCLELLERSEVFGGQVVDVGCGSGILSIGAALLGAERVLGIDSDPAAVEVARNNAQQNGLEIEFLCGEGFEPLSRVAKSSAEKQTISVAISNIISATLIRLAPDAAAAVSPGGRWIVSGVLKENWPDVLKAAEAAGFSLEDKRQEDDWVAAALLR